MATKHPAHKGTATRAHKITSQGASGVQYTFAVTDFRSEPRAIPAVYMFACRGVGGWKILYVGECGDLKASLLNNKICDEAVRWFGATHILVYAASKSEAARKRIERDLVLAKEPVMNVGNQASTSYAK